MRRFWMILSAVFAIFLAATLWYIGELSTQSSLDNHAMVDLTKVTNHLVVHQINQDLYVRWLEEEVAGMKWEMEARGFRKKRTF